MSHSRAVVLVVPAVFIYRPRFHLAHPPPPGRLPFSLPLASPTLLTDHQPTPRAPLAAGTLSRTPPSGSLITLSAGSCTCNAAFSANETKNLVFNKHAYFSRHWRPSTRHRHHPSSLDRQPAEACSEDPLRRNSATLKNRRTASHARAHTHTHIHDGPCVSPRDNNVR